MKPQRKSLLMLLLCLSTAVSYSQVDTRPKVFQNFPESFNVGEQVLQNVFQSADGQDVSLALNSNFNFPGKVLSNLVKYSNLQSVTIKSSLFDNAILHLSKITNEDNSITYVGRIMNERAFDGYEIKKNTDGSYSFKKVETGRVMQDCSF